MDIREVARLRLRNQRVTGDKFESADEVVGWLVAVQAQEYEYAKWSIGMRLARKRGRAAAIERAVAEGRILRTHILRPTWHFVLPADIRWLMALSAPRLAVLTARRRAQLGLDDGRARRARQLLTRALAGGNHLTRLEIGERLRRDGLATEGQQLAWIMLSAEVELLVASGRPKGVTQTYALLDEVAPGTAEESRFDRDTMLAELARRYFTAHGPATPADLSWWSSLSLADARRGIAACEPALERLEVDGTAYWWAGDTCSGRDDSSPTIHLMQAFDEYIVGYRSPRSEINLAGLGPRGALNRLPWLHAVMLDGQLVGWWRRRTRANGGKGALGGRDAFSVETKLLRGLTAGERVALEAATARYLGFVGANVSIPAVHSPRD